MSTGKCGWRTALLALIAVAMVAVGIALFGPIKKAGHAEYHNLLYDCAGIWLAFIYIALVVVISRCDPAQEKEKPLWLRLAVFVLYLLWVLPGAWTLIFAFLIVGEMFKRPPDPGSEFLIFPAAGGLIVSSIVAVFLAILTTLMRRRMAWRYRILGLLPLVVTLLLLPMVVAVIARLF